MLVYAELLLYCRIVAGIQTFSDFIGDVVCWVAIQQIVECCVADNQVITLALVIFFKEKISSLRYCLCSS